MLQPVVRRTWAPRGQTPIACSWDRHDRLSVISALTVAPKLKRLGLYSSVLDRNVRTPEVSSFLHSVQRQLRRGLLVVADRLNVHRSALRLLIERRPDLFAVEWLPAYAPELNPVEHVWGHTKYSDLANFIPKDVAELRLRVEHSLYTNTGRPDLLGRFFKQSGLEL